MQNQNALEKLKSDRSHSQRAVQKLFILHIVAVEQ